MEYVNDNEEWQANRFSPSTLIFLIDIKLEG